MKLYRNNGNGKFTDVTKEAGLDCMFQGIGVAVGDFDNDGWPDLFVSGVGVNHLFHNDHGKFVDVTGRSGIPPADNEWGTSCGLVRLQQRRSPRSVRLPLRAMVEGNRSVARFPPHGPGPGVWSADQFPGLISSLYHNNGHGKFTDVSEAAGIRIKNPDTGVPMAKSLGVAFADLDGDGLDGRDRVERHGAEFRVSQPARRQVQGNRRHVRASPTI